MISNTVNCRASRTAIRGAVTQAPRVARSGGAIANAMMTRCGMVALSYIRQAFILKARGGTDAAGESWQPLSPKTIAYSKTRQRGRGGRTKAEKGRSARPSQALNTKQQARWWDVYRRQLAIRKGNKGHAAAVAWLILKAEGAQTLVDKYGHRKVEILRDTGLLLNSLSPGYSGPEQVFRIGNGYVIVGTNRKGASAHHHGIPNRLPQRRLWPAPSRWPSLWWDDILAELRAGILEIATYLIKTAR